MSGSRIYKVTRKRITESLVEKKRFDGRGLFDYRNAEIELVVSKNAEGSVKVRLGKTEVVAGIKMSVGEPYPDHEKEGTLMTTIELLPLSSPEFEYGPPRIDSIEIARIIDRGIRESRFIDFEKLCIKEGEKVWNIFVDLATINYDGNIIDAAALAAILALKIAKMPEYDKKTEKVKFGKFTDEGLPLTDHMPLTMTFYKVKDHIFVDPVREEEDTAEGRLTVEMSHSSKSKEEMINALQKGGEITFSSEELEVIFEQARKIFKKQKELVDSELAKVGKPAKK